MFYLGTSINLLEAQAATGRIINPVTGEKLSVKEAASKKLIDRQFETSLSRLRFLFLLKITYQKVLKIKNLLQIQG